MLKMMPGSVPAGGFQGERASYVALSAVTTLGLSLLTSIWQADVSAVVALLGLLAVYMASSEMLVLVGFQLVSILSPLLSHLCLATLAVACAEEVVPIGHTLIT